MHFDWTISFGNVLTIGTFALAVIIDRFRLERRLQALETDQPVVVKARELAAEERKKILEQLHELTIEVARLQERMDGACGDYKKKQHHS